MNSEPAITVETRSGPVRNPKFTIFLYTLFFIIGLVTVVLLHPRFSTIDFFLNSSLFHLSTYPADAGHHDGLDVSGKVIDGILIHESIEPDRSHIRLAEDLELTPPFNMEIRLLWQYDAVFSVRFAGNSKSALVFRTNSNLNEKCVFYEMGGTRVKVFDLPDFGQLDGGSFPLVIELFFDGSLIQLSLNGHSAEGISPVEFREGDFEFQTLSPCAWVLVDEVTITKVDATFETGVVAAAGFHHTPFFIDLPGMSGTGAGSRSAWIFSFVLLFLAAVLFDLLVLGANSFSRSAGALSTHWLLFLFLPLQAVTCFFLEACFNLSYIPLVICLAALTLVKTVGLFRFDLVADKSTAPEGGLKHRRLLTAAAAVILYSLFLLLVSTGRPDTNVPATAAVYFTGALTPLLLLAVTMRVFHDYPPVFFLVAATQFFSFFFFRLSSDSLDQVSFSSLALFPWMLATAVFVLKNRRRKSPASPVVVYGVLFLLAVIIETGLKEPLFLDENIDHCRELGMLSWDAKKHTNLLRRDSVSSFSTVMGRSYQRNKPAGVFRIVCLGSSSTAGQGSTDMTNCSYPPRLQKILNEQGGQVYEVINGGIPGAPFYMLQVYFQQVLLPLDPDLLIIYFGSNGDNTASRIYYQRMAEEVEAAPFISTNSELWAAMRLKWNPELLIRGYFIAARFRTFRAVIRFIDGFRELILPVHEIRDRDDLSPGSVYSSPETVVESAIGTGCKVMLVPEVTFPDIYAGTVQHEYFSVFEELAEKFGEDGVVLQDFHRFFTSEVASENLIDDVHFHDQGYRWMAEHFAEMLGEKRLVPAVDPVRPGME